MSEQPVDSTDLFTWVEIGTADLDASERFYTAVFGGSSSSSATSTAPPRPAGDRWAASTSGPSRSPTASTST